VHAEGNVCAFDAELPLPLENLAKVLNAALPRDVRVLRAHAAAANFHPRFDARCRWYQYQIRGPVAPMEQWRYCWELEAGIDVEAMVTCAELFRGEHDFAAFAAEKHGAANSICTVTEIELDNWRVFAPSSASAGGSLDLKLNISANRFLRHMVCRIVGAVVAAGLGKLSLDEVRDALETQKRIKFKPAPPRGLTLMKVEY
jgi:tRNA pseudouridine38-40 synthase